MRDMFTDAAVLLVNLLTPSNVGLAKAYPARLPEPVLSNGSFMLMKTVHTGMLPVPSSHFFPLISPCVLLIIPTPHQCFY